MMIKLLAIIIQLTRKVGVVVTVTVNPEPSVYSVLSTPFFEALILVSGATPLTAELTVAIWPERARALGGLGSIVPLM